MLLCRTCLLKNVEQPFFGEGKYNIRNCFCKMCRKTFARKKWEHGGLCSDCIGELFSHSYPCGRCNISYTKGNGKRGLCFICINYLTKDHRKINYKRYSIVDPYEKWIKTESCPKCYVCKDVINIDKYHQIPGLTCDYKECRLQFYKHVIVTVKECLDEFGVSKDMKNYICEFIEP